MRYSNEQALYEADISVGANGAAIDTSSIYRVTYQAVTTGSPSSFTVKLQGSNDQPAGAGNNVGTFVPSNWSDISDTSSTITSAGAVIIPATEISYRYIRVVASADSGSGTLTVRINGQGW